MICLSLCDAIQEFKFTMMLLSFADDEQARTHTEVSTTVPIQDSGKYIA